MKNNIVDEEREYLVLLYEENETNYSRVAQILSVNPSDPWLAMNKGYVTPKLKRAMRAQGIGLPVRVRRGGWFTRDEARILDAQRDALDVSWRDVIKMGLSSYMLNRSKYGSAKRMIKIQDAQVIEMEGG